MGSKNSYIVIYPFGGITIINGYLNDSILKELIIVLSGPIFQILLYFVLLIFYKNNLISEINFNILERIHINLLYFNLLPIIPLDGSRIMLLIIEKIFPYKNSNYLIIVISFISIFLLAAFEKRIIFILFSFLLIKSIFKEYYYVDSKFNKFILERYLYNFKFNKTKIVYNINSFKRGYKHKILVNSKIYDEKEYLNSFYINKIGSNN